MSKPGQSANTTASVTNKVPSPFFRPRRRTPADASCDSTTEQTQPMSKKEQATPAVDKVAGSKSDRDKRAANRNTAAAQAPASPMSEESAVVLHSQKQTADPAQFLEYRTKDWLNNESIKCKICAATDAPTGFVKLDCKNCSQTVFVCIGCTAAAGTKIKTTVVSTDWNCDGCGAHRNWMTPLEGIMNLAYCDEDDNPYDAEKLLHFMTHLDKTLQKDTLKMEEMNWDKATFRCVVVCSVAYVSHEMLVFL